ncbi:MAG: esterase-like activity of phytase family protein [Hyphomonadaceae bacterium]|nr:esterase-like activity of phytase family protein [Hyphomonadaceae bacterium]
MALRQTALAVVALASLSACMSNGPAPIKAAAPVAAEAAPAPVEPPRVWGSAVAPGMVQPPTQREVVLASDPGPWKGGLDAYIRALSEKSCPTGTNREAGESITITAKPVPLQALNPARKKIGNLTFVAGFHLTSPDKRFGGLSGIEILENGNLLAVSDEGEFVWLDLAPDGLTPVRGRKAAMKDANGQPLQGKTNGDSEGLALNGGMALVSFERNHRVLAFDIGKCGAAARGAPIAFGKFGAPLPEAFANAGIAVGNNEGPEALGVTSNWYVFTGIEQKINDVSPLSVRPIEEQPDFKPRLGVEAPELVGIDLLPEPWDGQDVRAFSLHRSFNPVAGNAITIIETDFLRYLDQSNLPRRIVDEFDERSRYRYEETGWRELARLNLLVTVDNFEGIAAKELPDGRVRLFVISDDNFSESQRTLLMVFDLEKETISKK